LTEEIDNKNFEFFRTKLTGTTEQKERWKRAVAVVSSVLGEALGKIYVERHFPPEHKAKMEQLVDDLLEAYSDSIKNLDWMTEEIDNKNFEFFRTKLTGTTEQKERWKRAVAVVSSVLGEALGKIYVERHFPPEHKAKMEQLVDDLLEAYSDSIKNLDWMTEE